MTDLLSVLAGISHLTAVERLELAIEADRNRSIVDKNRTKLGVLLYSITATNTDHNALLSLNLTV